MWMFFAFVPCAITAAHVLHKVRARYSCIPEDTNLRACVWLLFLWFAEIIWHSLYLPFIVAYHLNDRPPHIAHVLLSCSMILACSPAIALAHPFPRIRRLFLPLLGAGILHWLCVAIALTWHATFPIPLVLWAAATLAMHGRIALGWRAFKLLHAAYGIPTIVPTADT